MNTELIVSIENKPHLLSMTLAFIGGVVAGVIVYRRWAKLRYKDELEVASLYDMPREPLACEINDAMMSRFLKSDSVCK